MTLIASAGQESRSTGNLFSGSSALEALTLLEAQSDHSSAEHAALLAQANETTALVALYKALGGGWEAVDRERI